MFIGSCAATFFALDKESGLPIWSYDIKQDGDQNSFHGEMLLTDDLVIVGTDTKIGHVYAFDRESGAVRWKYRVPGSGAPTDILRSDSKIYTVVDGDILLCLYLESGELLWQFKSESEAETPILMIQSADVSNGRVFFGSQSGQVHALDKDSGELIWTQNLGARISTAVRAHGDDLLLGTAERFLYRLSQGNGEVLSKLATDLVPVGRPSVGDSAFYVFLSEGGPMRHDRGRQLWAFDSSLEKELWSQQPDFIWSATKSYIWKNALLTGTEFGEVVAYDLKDGHEEWTVQVDGTVRSIGTSEHMLFVGTIEGTVYAIDTRY